MHLNALFGFGSTFPSVDEHVVVYHLIACCWPCLISGTLRMSSAYEFAKYVYFAYIIYSIQHSNSCNLL